MKLAFVDAWYWIAVARPGDQHKESAARARSTLGDVRLVTTDGVLMEFLAGLANGGPSVRAIAVKMTRAILEADDTEVLSQDRESFLEGLRLYEERPDKAYSLVDCMSMNVMQSRGIKDVLTGDHHFSQEGLVALPGAER